MHVYIFKINMVCIKYIYIYYKLHEYKYIHVNIFKIYPVYVYLYMHNKYTQYTNICKQKLIFGCD